MRGEELFTSVGRLWNRSVQRRQGRDGPRYRGWLQGQLERASEPQTKVEGVVVRGLFGRIAGGHARNPVVELLPDVPHLRSEAEDPRERNVQTCADRVAWSSFRAALR